MNEQECLEAIAQGDSAYSLVREQAPHLERRFNRLCKSMCEFLSEAQKTFPDAQYYTAGGGFCLMLGKPHSDDRKSTKQTQLIALTGIRVQIGDGDF